MSDTTFSGQVVVENVLYATRFVLSLQIFETTPKDDVLKLFLRLFNI